VQTDVDTTFRTEAIQVNMGPQHPSTHGVLRLILKLDGERVVSAKPDIGFLHRGMEKLAEKRTYPQYLTLTDRFDYLASMFNNYVYCAAVEKLMGLQIPPRAQALRVLVMELNRIASHLVFYGTMGLDLGASTPFIYGFREREAILDLFESLCGSRLTFSYMRIGGVSHDIPDGFIEGAREFLGYFPKKIEEYDNLLSLSEILIVRTRGIAPVSGEEMVNWGVSGPMLRASGVPWDLRKTEPYSGYENYDFDIATLPDGDTYARYLVRIEELRQSARIVAQVLDNLPDGSVTAKVPRAIKPPEGESYARVESARGEIGCYIVSDGSTKPYRLKWRGPCFSNLAVIGRMAPGILLADLVAALGSFDLVLGEVDR
jgi:NADH-quinone oxidoreductase subunit D